jgi:undecaprenyl-diphosphatase
VSTFEALLLGLVQGLTEFLPVSSSGHLVLTRELLGLEPTGLALEVSVHAATLLAVVVVLWREVLGLVRGGLNLLRGRADEDGRLLLLVALGTIPAVAVGLLLKDEIERAFADPRYAAVGLIFTAVLLAPTWFRHGGERRIDAVLAVVIGCAQALAICPGVSRSGSTIAVALLLGAAAPRAFAFSFLLSIPAILGATVLVLPDALGEGAAPGLVGNCLAAALAAFVSGVVALRLLRRVVERGRLAVFAPYCLVVGVLALLLL